MKNQHSSLPLTCFKILLSYFYYIVPSHKSCVADCFGGKMMGTKYVSCIIYIELNVQMFSVFHIYFMIRPVGSLHACTF